MSAQWRVPAVTQESSGFYADSTWIGVGGWGTSGLLQAGTSEQSENGKLYYFVWDENLPGQLTEVYRFAVSPGDVISADISLLSGSTWKVSVTDVTTGQSDNQTETYTGSTASAEFIQEAPSVANNVVPMDPYQEFTFYNAQVNGTGDTLNPSQEVTMPGVSVPSSPNASANAIDFQYGGPTPNSPFSCGAQTSTYEVGTTALGGPGIGVRCVKFTVQSPLAFEWYGEGEWGGCSYRHLGEASGTFSTGLIGSAADIYGNGECFDGNADGTLKFSTSSNPASGPPNTIAVTGAWHETWTLVGALPYFPLTRTTTCGAHFTQYTATSGTPGSGIRCILPEGVASPVVWYGAGNWNGVTYSHLGDWTPSNGEGGASDLCGGNLGEDCNYTPYGAILLAPRGQALREPTAAVAPPDTRRRRGRCAARCPG